MSLYTEVPSQLQRVSRPKAARRFIEATGVASSKRAAIEVTRWGCTVGRAHERGWDRGGKCWTVGKP